MSGYNNKIINQLMVDYQLPLAKRLTRARLSALVRAELQLLIQDCDVVIKRDLSCAYSLLRYMISTCKAQRAM
jgi:hypothetical protein